MTHAHTEDELRRAEHYIVRAKEIAAKGFYTKSEKKDANDYLSRAYEVLVKYEFNHTVWNSRVRAADDSRWVHTNPAWQKLDYANFPDLRIWAKNPAKWAKVYADFPAVVARGNELGALRAAFDAAPLVEKPKSKMQVQREERAAIAKTCQICGRPILAETGLIAHHGYQRPDRGSGYQTSSCYGARHEPFEKSRNALGKYLTGLNIQLSTMQQRQRKVKDEKVALTFSYWTGKYDNRHKHVDETVIVTRRDFDAAVAFHKANARFASDMPLSFDRLKEKALNAIAADIKAQKEYISHQQKRYDAWRPA